MSHYIKYIIFSSQFLLTPDSPTSSCDAIPWEYIAQVVCWVDENASCPICLEFPSIPRMGRCGHIYCWPCAIKYVRFENEGVNKKCAVCSWLICLNEMKRYLCFSVIILRVCLNTDPIVTAGSKLEMMLLKKSMTSLVHAAHPAAELDSNINRNFVRVLSTSEMSSLHMDEINGLEALKTAVLDECDPEILPCIDFALECSANETKNKQPAWRDTKHSDCAALHSTNQEMVDDCDIQFYQGIFKHFLIR